MALPVEAWDPELFQDLQQLLTRISTQPTTSTIRRFAARLDDASPWITSLTHFPGPNEAERQALEQGTSLLSHKQFPSRFRADIVVLTQNRSFYLPGHLSKSLAHSST